MKEEDLTIPDPDYEDWWEEGDLEGENYLLEARIEEMRAKGNKMLPRNLSLEDEKDQMAQSIEHQLTSRLESIEQIEEMLREAGAKPREAKTIMKRARKRVA